MCDFCEIITFSNSLLESFLHPVWLLPQAFFALTDSKTFAIRSLTSSYHTQDTVQQVMQPQKTLPAHANLQSTCSREDLSLHNSPNTKPPLDLCLFNVLPTRPSFIRRSEREAVSQHIQHQRPPSINIFRIPCDTVQGKVCILM